MPDSYKILQANDKRVICQLPDLNGISGTLLEELLAKFDLPAIILTSPIPLRNEYGRLSGIEVPRQLWIGYQCIPGQILYTQAALPYGIDRHKFECFEQLRDFYVRTRLYYFEKWKSFLPDGYERVVRNDANKYLPSERVTVFSKNGLPVAIMTIAPDLRDYNDRNAWWVTWVWISSQLDFSERAGIRNCFARELASCTADSLQSVVRLFNIPSQKHFRKMGFSPGCVQVIKEQKLQT